jgi:hypothetical protein
VIRPRLYGGSGSEKDDGHESYPAEIVERTKAHYRELVERLKEIQPEMPRRNGRSASDGARHDRRTAFRHIAMGAVTLHVSNLDAITTYYRDAVALRVMDATGDTVTLGCGGIPSVVLTHASS